MRALDCSNCVFFDHHGRQKLDEKVLGACRVDAPSISSKCVLPQRDAWAGYWPWVSSDDWCGRHVFYKRRTAMSVQIGAPTTED
jgi:hypothetical protein